MQMRTNLRLERGAATRGTLLAAARQLFTDKGYYDAATEDLVAAAGVTRGALYHHYAGKEPLFEAVFREIAGELFVTASAAVAPVGDNWGKLQEGLQAHLAIIAESREIQRVLLLDGPSVLGWPKWRELQSEFSLGALIDVMEALTLQGVITFHSPLSAAHLVFGALNEAALMIAHAENPR